MLLIKKKLSLIFISLLVVLTLGGCSSWQRGLKSVSSELGGGLHREVKILSQTGEIIHQDSGKFDVEVNDYRVKYINSEGKLIIVYLGGSTAVVTEK